MSPLFWPAVFGFAFFVVFVIPALIGYFLSRAASKKDPKPEDCNDD